MSEIISYAGPDELWEAWSNHAYGPHNERPNAPPGWEARRSPDEDEREVLRWHPVGTLIAWSGCHSAIVLDGAWLVDGKWMELFRTAAHRHREDPIQDFVEQLPGW